MVVLINVHLLAHVTVSRDMLASFGGDFCFLVVYVARDVVLKPMVKKNHSLHLTKILSKMQVRSRYKCANGDN